MNKAKQVIKKYLDMDDLDLYEAMQTTEGAKVSRTALKLLSAMLDEGWRPIEEAPRDGTRILARVKFGTTEKIMIIWWAKNHGSGMWIWSITQSYKIHPTEWKPLSTPSDQIIEEFIKECENGL